MDSLSYIRQICLRNYRSVPVNAFSRIISTSEWWQVLASLGGQKKSKLDMQFKNSEGSEFATILFQGNVQKQRHEEQAAVFCKGRVRNVRPMWSSELVPLEPEPGQVWYKLLTALGCIAVSQHSEVQRCAAVRAKSGIISMGWGLFAVQDLESSLAIASCSHKTKYILYWSTAITRFECH